MAPSAVDRPLMIVWTIDEWPLASRWADYVGLPSELRRAPFHGWAAGVDHEVSIYDAFPEPERPPELIDAGFWVAQCGWSACLAHPDVCAIWQPPAGLIDEDLTRSSGVHFGDREFFSQFGFHLGANLDAITPVLEQDGFEVRHVSSLLEQPAAAEIDRRVLQEAARRELSQVVMEVLNACSGIHDEAKHAQEQLRQWGLPSELSLAGAFDLRHGNSAMYAALSMTRNTDELIAHLRTCKVADRPLLFARVTMLIAFFAPSDGALRDGFAQRIAQVLDASPHPIVTRDYVEEDPELATLIRQLLGDAS